MCELREQKSFFFQLSVVHFVVTKLYDEPKGISIISFFLVFYNKIIYLTADFDVLKW